MRTVQSKDRLETTRIEKLQPMWMWALPLLAAVIALVVTFHPLSVNLTTLPLSGSTNESLGVFALLLSAWLIWREKERLKVLPVQPDAWGLVFLLVGALLALAGYRLVMRFALGVSLALIVTGAVWWLWGRNWIKHLWFPLLLLIAIVPLPLDLVGAIAFRMQTIVARFTAFLAGLLGIPVERVGVTLNIPGHVIQVNEACSGWHSFSAAFWLFLLLLYWQRPKNWWQWLWVIPALFPIAIIANIFRVTTVVVTAANGFDLLLHSPWHEILGLGYFLLLVWLLFRYAIKWQSGGTSNVVCSLSEVSSSPLPARTRVWQLTGLLWVVAGLTLWTGWQMGRAASEFKPPNVPNQVGEWIRTWENVEGLDDGYWFLQARYETKNKSPLQVFLHIPIENRHRPKRLLNLWLGQGYELASSETVSVSLPTRTVPIQLVKFVKGDEQQFVAVTYLHPKRAVTSPVTARWHRMKEQLIWGVSKPWLAIGVAGVDRKEVINFAKSIAAEMDKWLSSQ